jgi:hypothetical protein
MELGTDGAADETLAGLRKGFHFSDVLQVHERIVAEGIPCAHFIMLGGPNENASTLKQGLCNIDKLNGSVVFGFIGIRILPGTGIFDQAVSDGLISPEQSLIRPEFYYSPHLCRQEIEKSLEDSFGRRIDRIYPCHEFNGRIAMLHKMGHVGPLWDLLLRKKRR